MIYRVQPGTDLEPSLYIAPVWPRLAYALGGVFMFGWPLGFPYFRFLKLGALMPMLPDAREHWPSVFRRQDWLDEAHGR